MSFVSLTAPDRTLTIFNIKLIWLNAHNAHRLLLTVGYVAAVLLISRGIGWSIDQVTRRQIGKRGGFWLRQVLRMIFGLLLIIGLISIWFDDPARAATFLGLISAGLAFALQRVVTAFAGYIVILRGNTFTVGDRITMGGVRGDVIKLGFIQTTIMEMGQPPGEQADDPAMWVRSRQYTGRVVTVTNDKVFDTPVYNYTKDFPYIWEEMLLPISYKDDFATAEKILLTAARDLTIDIASQSEPAIAEMERRYVMKRSEMHPQVFMRLTDNWIELSVRFITHDHNVRSLKDKMWRRILHELNNAKIGIASGTYEIVGLPPVQVQTTTQNAPDPANAPKA